MKANHRIITLLYHRILPTRGFDPFNIIVTTKTFIKQLETIAKKYPVISLNDAVDQLRHRRFKARQQVVLTFDDGYRDNYEAVFPILKRKGLPATFFLTTGYINSDRVLWDWGLVNLLNSNRMIKGVKINNRMIRHKTNEPRILFIIRALEKFKAGSPEAINKFACGSKKDICLTWEQVKAMSQNGMEIGSHGMFHRSLSMIPAAEARQEIISSKEAVEKAIQRPCRHFAFPFGTGRDYNNRLISCVKEAGFKTCHINRDGCDKDSGDGFCFGRAIVKEFSDAGVL